MNCGTKNLNGGLIIINPWTYNKLVPCRYNFCKSTIIRIEEKPVTREKTVKPDQVITYEHAFRRTLFSLVHAKNR